MPSSSSPKPPDGPRQATIRARTRVNPVRPEVIGALEELERSLGDVSRWEQLLTGKEPEHEWERPGTRPPRGRHLPPGHLSTGEEEGEEADDPEGFEEAAVALHAAIQHLDDRIEGIRSEAEQQASGGPVPILEPDDPPAVDASPAPEPVAPILVQARTVEPVPRRSLSVTPEEEDELDRRRRNGRLLTWVGLALLVAVGAVFFLPDDGGDDPPEVPVTVPTVTVTSQVPFDTTPLLPADDVTTVPVVPIDQVTTTSGPTVSTKKPSAPKPTVPQTTQPTVPQTTQPTLVIPGPSSTSTVATTTSTTAPTTTSTASDGLPPPDP